MYGLWAQMAAFDLDHLIPLYIGHEKQNARDILRPQLEHRVHLVRDVWKITPGSRVLEIGGGQGDCTLVLAAAVGPDGRVEAVDPCSLDYGTPWTVGEAQGYLKNGPLGGRMSFFKDDPVHHIATSGSRYDYVVLNNSAWYFDFPSRLGGLLDLLAQRTCARTILIAEWSLEARSLNQVPHVLAALAIASLESLKPESHANIRSPVSPDWFRRWAKEKGVEIRHEALLSTPIGMMDGQWEVGAVLAKTWEEEVTVHAKSEPQALALRSARDAVRNAVSVLPNGRKDVACMMIWCAEM